MKMFGDPETKKKFDKGAAFIVFNIGRAALLSGLGGF